MKRYFLPIMVMCILFTLVFGGPLVRSASTFTKDDFAILNGMKEYLPDNIVVINDTAYVYVERIDFQSFYRGFALLKPFQINKIVIDLYSHGGAVFDAMAMGAIITEQIKSGKTVIINARGLVASAGLIILISGSSGHRYIDQDSMIMFHEMSVYDF